MSDMSEAPRMERPEDPVSKMTNNRQFKLLADIPVRMSVEVGSTSLLKETPMPRAASKRESPSFSMTICDLRWTKVGWT